MAKKDISKFQEALLSKTKIIKADSKETSTVKEPKDKKTDQSINGIKPNLLKGIERLSKEHNLDKNDLINYAVEFFLSFENELFENSNNK